MLFFDEPTTVAMLLRITREERYTPGYWRAAPDAYVRDAMVYGRLVAERHPELGALLQQACIVPEAYASKWFIGLCVHVLPFTALFSFVEASDKQHQPAHQPPTRPHPNHTPHPPQPQGHAIL